MVIFQLYIIIIIIENHDKLSVIYPAITHSMYTIGFVIKTSQIVFLFFAPSNKTENKICT